MAMETTFLGKLFDDDEQGTGTALKMRAIVNKAKGVKGLFVLSGFSLILVAFRMALV